MERYGILYKMLEYQGSPDKYPEYLETINGLPDIYADTHIRIVTRCIDKCSKYDRKFVNAYTIKPVWVDKS